MVLLSLFFSRSAQRLGALLLVILALLAALALRRANRVNRAENLLSAWQDTTDQLRVHGTYLLLIASVALVERLWLEVILILGAFVRGVTLGLSREMASYMHDHGSTRHRAGRPS